MSIALCGVAMALFFVFSGAASAQSYLPPLTPAEIPNEKLTISLQGGQYLFTDSLDLSGAKDAHTWQLPKSATDVHVDGACATKEGADTYRLTASKTRCTFEFRLPVQGHALSVAWSRPLAVRHMTVATAANVDLPLYLNPRLRGGKATIGGKPVILLQSYYVPKGTLRLNLETVLGGPSTEVEVIGGALAACGIIAAILVTRALRRRP